MHFVDFDSIEWVSNAPGARQKAFVSGNQRMRLVEFLFIPAGEEHRHMVRMGKGGWVRILLFEIIDK